MFSGVTPITNPPGLCTVSRSGLCSTSTDPPDGKSLWMRASCQGSRERPRSCSDWDAAAWHRCDVLGVPSEPTSAISWAISAVQGESGPETHTDERKELTDGPNHQPGASD